ncbi:MAG TPA: SDR family oxidoreductase [Sunxiuqinia sp.]|nr:SDR family oxidoreductase [Sunxiuqinia sp.]
MMKNQNPFFTLITGASTGLGKAFAIECARREMNLILVSLPEENLKTLSNDLSLKYGIQVFFREIDLTERSAVEELGEWVTQNYKVNMLINNAGVGGTCLFEKSTADYLDNIIQLNVRAMTLLTRYLVPAMQKLPQAFILNVSSLAAFSPVPFKTVYPASKAFVHHFTRGLRAELKDSGVKVSVLNPGPIITNSDVKQRIDKQSFYIKLSIMSPERIAQIAIKKLLKGRAVIIPGFMNQFNSLMIRVVPVRFRIFVGANIFKRDFKETPSNESVSNRSERPAWQQSGQEAVTRKVRS